jgi:hypothetical protein
MKPLATPAGMKMAEARLARGQAGKEQRAAQRRPGQVQRECLAIIHLGAPRVYSGFDAEVAPGDLVGCRAGCSRSRRRLARPCGDRQRRGRWH